MTHAKGAADLHIHTDASDGESTVEQLVQQARERNLESIAITDHDCIPDCIDSAVMERDGVTVITGVEVRADVRDTKVEILGYFVDPSDDRLDTVLRRARSNRVERNRRLIDRLATETDLDLNYDSLASDVDGLLGRPHVADKLVEEGVVDGIGDAFDEYLAEDGAAFVPMERVPHEEVIQAIQRAGGVASLAHPGRIRTSAEGVRTIVEELKEAGLDALEVQYPYGESGPGKYADVNVEDAADLAAEHDLVRTGGSDCHGPGSGKFRIGDVRVSRSTVDSLRTLAAER